LHVDIPLCDADKDTVGVHDVRSKWDAEAPETWEHSSTQAPMQHLPGDHLTALVNWNQARGQRHVEP
jgi:hypothetical protein